MTQKWSVTVSGRPHRKAHRLRDDGQSICGLIGAPEVFVDADPNRTRCGLCLSSFLDLAEGLSNYTVDANGCWLWGGYRDKNGYGKIHIRDTGDAEWAHRASYAFHVGPILPGNEIDHVCQNPPCMNPSPEHIEQVTKVEHYRRTWERLGRDDLHALAANLRRSRLTYREIAEVMGMANLQSAQKAVAAAVKRGLVDEDELPPFKRLTEQDREDIRAMYLFGIPQPAISRFYEIDNSQISRICTGRRSGRN